MHHHGLVVAGLIPSAGLRLAQLHSQAVDYSKSGIPAIMEPELRPSKKPHFLKKENQPAHRFYRSKKILGMLFDQVQLVDFVPQYENQFDEKILGAYKSDQEILAAAKELKQAYDSDLKRLMAKHAIGTEFEAWSVFVLSHNLESRDYTFAEEFGRTMGAMKLRFRGLCRKAVDAEGTHDSEKMSPFVAAMYEVTAAEVEAAVVEARKMGQAMTPENMPFMSFPWLFVDELGKIRNGYTRGRPEATILQQHAMPKKHVKREPERETGDIETAQGISHFGDLLKLDFNHGMYELNG